jgi:hypothetical protein
MEEQLRVAAGHNDVVMIRRLAAEGTDVNDQHFRGGRLTIWCSYVSYWRQVASPEL